MLAKLSTGQGFVRGALKATVVCFALTGAATIAQANPITGTFDVTIYQAYTGSSNINDPTQQAEQGNPLITGAGTAGTYTGALDLCSGSPGCSTNINTIDAFFASAGGTTTGLGSIGSNLLSTAPFDYTTVMVFTGTTNGIISGIIDHDDGASLYDGPGYSNPVMLAPGPVVATPTPYGPFSGNWQLIYVESNGLPAVLDFEVTRGNSDTTPLPAALPLFASGLGALGLVGWRRKRKSAAVATA